MIEGLENVLKNLNREVEKIKEKRMAGMMAAGFMILGRSQRRVPVHIGKLRASGYVRKETENSVVIGYSAKYARAVHENLEMKWRGKPRRDGKGVYWGPAGESKFLEKPFQEGKQEILNTVRMYSLIGG